MKLLAVVAVGLPQWLVAAAKPGKYGGADIKITSSAAFLLGLWPGLFAFITGMLLSIVIPTLTRLLRKQPVNQGTPLLPYLSIGILFIFLFF